MKTVYPLVALLSAAVVAAGPLPRVSTLNNRDNTIANGRIIARTDHVGEPAAAPAPPAPAAPVADPGKAEADRLGKSMEHSHSGLD
jgi:hypothetical protein